MIRSQILVRGIAAALVLAPLSTASAQFEDVTEEDAQDTPDVPEEDPVDPKARAAELVNQGNQLFEKGNVKGALEKYREAHKAYPSPKILFNIAEAYNELNDYSSAADHYERFLGESNLDPSSPIAQKAKERLRGLKSKLAWIELNSENSGAEISVDGKVVGSLPMDQPLRVEPGKHKIVASLPGYETFEGEVEAPAGETTSVDIELKLVEVQSAAAVEKQRLVTTETSRDTEGESVTSEWWFWTALGAAAVLTGTVIVVAAGAGGDDFVPTGELGASSTAEWMRF